jgi:methyl-accepting chemotaxis protein
MTMTVLYFLLLVFVAAGVGVVHLSMQRGTSRRLQHALALIGALRQLLEHVPKHRGMANAFLRGDTGFRASMEQMQASIARDFNALEQTAKRIGAANIDAVVAQLRTRWQRIAREVWNMAAPVSFQDHTDLVEQLIFSTEEIADDYGLDQVGGEHRAFFINTLTRGIPIITETIGQARGIGAGAAAKGECDVGTRVKLKYLHKHIESVLTRNLPHAPAGLAHINQHVQQATERTREFLHMLQQELIESRHLSIAPDKYYARATDALDANFRLFDAVMPILTAEVDRSAATASARIRNLHRAAMALLLASSSAVVLRIAGAI